MTKRNSTRKRTEAQARQDSKQRLTTATFVDKAVSIHGLKYCYDKVVYSNSRSKVDISCYKHGLFSQTASSHLQGVGCSECAKERRLGTKQSFIKAATVVHGSKFNYDKVDYINSREHVIIRCGIHGDFKQKPHLHVAGHGCNICNSSQPKNTKWFIKKAKEAHGRKYLYSKSIYVKTNEKLIITCPEHGDFEQIPASHLQGKGCRKCSYFLAGFSRTDFRRLCHKNNNGMANLYVIKCKDVNRCFYKIGITSKAIKERFSTYRRMPYDYDLLFLIDGDSGFIYDLEFRLHSILKRYSYAPSILFEGHTECFSSIKPIKTLLESIESSKQMQLLA